MEEIINKYKAFIANIEAELDTKEYASLCNELIAFNSISCYESFINDLETILERTDK